MPALSIALLAFATGATLLQWQPELAPIAPWFTGATASAICAVWLHRFGASRRATRRRATPGVNIVVAMLIAASTSALGFGYAAWRAEVRLADELPAAWEGIDITLVGVIDELPQASPRGTRFAF